MATFCGENTTYANNVVKRRQIAYRNNVLGIVGEVFGYESEMNVKLAEKTPLNQAALSAWKSMHTNLVNLLMQNAEEVGYDIYDPESQLESLRIYIQKQFKIPGGRKALVEHANARRILRYSKLTNQLIELKKSKWGKKISAWERALMPTTIFVMSHDKFGVIHKYITKVLNFREDHRRAAAKYKARYNDLNSNVIQSIRNTLIKLDYISPRYIFGNYNWDSMSGTRLMDTQEGISIQSKDLNEYLFFGSVKKPDGSIVHRVVNKSTGEKTELGQDWLDESILTEKLVDRYTFNLTNEVMDGQTRKVVWKDKLEDYHKGEKEHFFERWLAKKAIGDEAERKKGMPEIHTTIYDGKEFQYVIFKDEKNVYDANGILIRTEPAGVSLEETYSAYLLQHREVDFNNKPIGKPVYYLSGKNQKRLTLEKLRVRPDNPFKDGFYKANQYQNYGKRLGRSRVGHLFLKDDTVERGWDFSKLDQRYMNIQPDEDILTKFIKSKDPRMQSSNFWQNIKNLRLLYRDVWDDVSKLGRNEQKQLEKWLGTKGLLTESLGKYFDTKDRKELLNKLSEMFDINNRIWFDKNGNIVTPNTHMQAIGMNYSPRVYREGTIFNMLSNAIEDIERRIEEAQRKGRTKEVESLTKTKLELQVTLVRTLPTDEARDMERDLLTQLEKLPGKRDSRQVLAQQLVHTKHRATWTDPAQRVKDSSVFDQYIDNTFRSAYKNRLMLSMLETLDTIGRATKGQLNTDIVDWIINRTKIELGDPTSTAKFGKVDLSYSKLAEYLNKMPGVRKRKWDAESAQNLVRSTKGMFSMSLLGATGGMINRTQITNEFIGAGMHMIWKATRILYDKDNSFPLAKANAIIEHVGTDEITNAFMDHLSPAGDITLRDAALLAIPGVPFQMPTKVFLDFIKLNKRSGFIKKGFPQIDTEIKRLRKSNLDNNLMRARLQYEEIIKGISKKDKRRLDAELKKFRAQERNLKSEHDKADVQEVRAAFYDLFFKKEKDEKILRLRYQKLLGQLVDKRLRRMVSWKLSWWPEGFAPELFTFTEGERFMRKQSVIIALLHAAKLGELGKIDPESTTTMKGEGKDGKVVDVQVEDAFLSDAAVRIARNAVYNSMFGMSQVHLGEIATGMGEHVFLYKGYAWQQMLHDWNIVKSWLAGYDDLRKATRAMFDEALNAARRARYGIKYNPKDQSIDHETLQMLRFVGTRLSMSIIATSIEALSIFKFLIRTPMARQVSSMVRGGENPAIAIATRVLANAMIWSFLDDDDWEGGLVEIGWDVLRLFFPVFFTLPMNLVSEWLE